MPSPLSVRSDSTHVTIINSDCSMGMYIYSRANGRSVFANACYASPLPPRWQIQITSTKTPLPVYSKPHLGTGDENSPKRCLIYIYIDICILDKSRPVLPAIRSRIPALLNWKSRKEIDCGWYVSDT